MYIRSKIDKNIDQKLKDTPMDWVNKSGGASGYGLFRDTKFGDGSVVGWGGRRKLGRGEGKRGGKGCFICSWPHMLGLREN